MTRWKATRLRRVCQINPPIPEFGALAEDEPITFLPLEAIWPDALDVSRVTLPTQAASGYTRFLLGDILLPKITPTFEAARVAIANGLAGTVGCGTTELHVLRPGPLLYSRFLFYVLRSWDFLREGKANMYGVAGQKRVPERFIANYELRLPPLDEQRAIVPFLDEETAKIDILIAKKNRLIEGLQEEGTALVDNAVTGSHSVPEELPAGWSLVRNKNLFEEVNEKPKLDMELLTVSHLTGVTPRAEKQVYMFMAESFDDYKVCREGDLVINTMWAWMGAAGVSKREGIVSPSYGVYRLRRDDQLHPQFLDYLIRSKYYVGLMDAHSEGVWSSRLRLYPDEFLRMLMPIPPISIQYEIVQRLDAVLQGNRHLETKLSESIKVLLENRAALITAAVTGQIDVTKSA
ncbi:MAG: restriction endonuclease subunit S [Actinomycetota bacterium]